MRARLATVVLVLLGSAPLHGESLPALQDVQQVAAGLAHTCTLSRQGTVQCWGRNERGQLGLGDSSPTPRPTPVTVPGLSGIRAITSGDFHSCALTAAGGVKCWGWNVYGAIGIPEDGGVQEIIRPADVQGLASGVTTIDAGGFSTCAITTSGAVKCWGFNSNGQLGDSSTTNRFAPVDVSGLGSGIASISAGGAHACALTTAGKAKCWGSNANGRIGDNSLIDRLTPVDVQGIDAGLIAISAGGSHSCALTRSGGAKCWGGNGEGQSGDGNFLDRPTPVDVVGVTSGYTEIATGNVHGCALHPASGLKCWGPNSSGALGAGYEVPSFTTATVLGIGAGATGLSAGSDHNCVLLAGGLRCWGLNLDGQLGNDSTTRRLAPTEVSGLDSGMATIGGGSAHSCALSTSGGVKCWGQGGVLGDGTSTPRLTPVDVIGLQSGVLALAVGFGHNCVIVTGGGVKCWGPNYGLTPVDVVALGAAATAVDAGRNQGCALLLGGAVKCWGDNEFGQIGDGSTEQRLSAVQVSGLTSGITAISSGWFHNCGVTSAGGVKCWGLNGHGQLGDGSTVNRSTPVDVVGLGSGIRTVVAGLTHTCAITVSGAVKCWGTDFYDGTGTILGDGSERGRTVPGDIPALSSGVAELALGGFHSCARLTSGEMKCWGTNYLGPIGDNSEITRPKPVTVAGLTSGVQAIGVGHSNGHSCAVVSGGAAKCWGDNAFAMIGDGTTFGIPFAQTVVTNELARRIAPVVPVANDASTSSQTDASGRYVVFQSRASNLAAGDTNGAFDVFRTDRESGTTIRVSVDNAGAQIVGGSIEPSVSADGSLVVFVAADAAVGKILGESTKQGERRRKTTLNAVYMRNLVSGTTQRMGAAMAGGGGTQPQIAPAGTAVVFSSNAAGSSGATPNQSNIYVVPLTPNGNAFVPGTTRCVSCKSVDSNGIDTSTNANGESRNAVVSANGRYIAFETQAKNVLAASPSPCPGSSAEILLRDMVSGAMQRMSPPSATPSANCGSSGSTQPSIDYAGGTLAFQSDQPLQSSDHNGVSDIYVLAPTTGVATPQRVSAGPAGEDGNGASTAPSVSGDGLNVAFVSAAPNLDLSFGDNNDRSDVHTARVDGDGEIARLSRSSSGAEANAASERPALNYDGTRVAFDSAAGALAGGNTSGQSAIYQRSNPLATPVRSATWWKSNESGWGLTIFDQGNVLAPAWFTYDSDGEPTWFLVGGAFPQADGSYRGDLLRLTGTPFDRIEGPAATSATPIGNVVLRYSGEDTLAFQYTALGITQTKTLGRFPFGTRTFACTSSPNASRDDADNVSDLWTGAVANAGWGLTLFHVDNSVFAGWYTYDTDGEAVFFVIATTRQADGSFTGPIVRQRNGVPFLQIDGQASSAGNDVVGNATFRFSDGDSGTFSYTVGTVVQSKPIVRLLVGSRPSECSSVSLAPGG